MTITTKLLSAESWADYESLMGPSEGCDGCWCYNHHIPAGAPDVVGKPAKDAFRVLVEAGKVHGVLAYIDDVPVGWCAVDRRIDLVGHDCTMPFETTAPNRVWSIHCFFVRPESRGRGVAGSLLRAAEALVIEEGGWIVEAYPSPPESAPADVFDFCGAYKMFEGYDYALLETLNVHYTRMNKIVSSGKS